MQNGIYLNSREDYTFSDTTYRTIDEPMSTPSAVQRRREQNRIAQRNHRRKVKGQTLETENSQATQNAQAEIPSESPHDLSRTASNMSANASMNPWYGYDFSHQQGPALPNPVLGNEQDIFMLDQDFSKFQNRCAFCSFSGPCEFHREEMKSFTFNMDPTRPHTNLGMPFDGHIDPSVVSAKPILGSPLSAMPALGRSETHPQHSPRPSGFKQKRHSISATSGKATPTPEEVNNITARFKIILDSIQAAGFEDFDAMVASYYTCVFDKNSVADVSQKTSRGRRLRGVLSSLHESSAEWTLWEARGYRDKIVEAAESIYVAELHRLAQSRKRSNGSVSGSSSELDDSPSHSDNESSNDSSTGVKMAQGCQIPSGEVLRVYQNKLPNLWALLTELAGTQGPQGERAALAAALLLFNARQNPDMDTQQLILGSLGQSNLAGC